MNTIVDLLENSAQKYANNPYILEKRTDRYEALTYRETKEQAYKVAAGLMALGAKKGDRIALLSESRTDWVISELGVLHTGAMGPFLCPYRGHIYYDGHRSQPGISSIGQILSRQSKAYSGKYQGG